MSNESIPKIVEDIKDRADTKLELLAATREALVATAKRFSLDLAAVLQTHTEVVEALVGYQDVRQPERIRDMQHIVLETVNNMFRLHLVGTPDIMAFFSEELRNRLPGDHNA